MPSPARRSSWRPQPAPRCRRQGAGRPPGGLRPPPPQKPERRARPNLQTPAPQARGARLRGQAGFRLSLQAGTHPPRARGFRSGRDAPVAGEHAGPAASARAPGGTAGPGPQRPTAGDPSSAAPQTWPAASGAYLLLLLSPEFSARARGLPASPGAGPRGRDGLRAGEQAGRIVTSRGGRATSSDFVVGVRLQIRIIFVLLSG